MRRAPTGVNRQARAAMEHMKGPVQRQHGAVIMVGVQPGKRHVMSGKPLGVMRAQLVRGRQEPHAPVTRGPALFDESDLAEPRQEMVDLSRARIAEHGQLLLQGSDREPGFAPRQILRGFKHRCAVEYQKSTRLEQEPNQKRIASVHFGEAIEISSPGLRQPRMVHDLLEAQPQRAAGEALEFVSFQGCPQSRILESIEPLRSAQCFPNGVQTLDLVG